MAHPTSWFRAGSLLAALALVPPALCLGAACTTWQGGCFALAAFLLPVGLVLMSWRAEHYWSYRVGTVLLGVSVVLAAFLFIKSPDGRPVPGGKVSNQYLKGEWSYKRQALGAVLPEVDQLMMGFSIMPYLDPYLTLKQAKGLRASTSAIYEELEKDKDFKSLGSVLPDAYAEMMGQRFDRGHYFLYVPTGVDVNEPAPVLLFLHGSGGNFKAYTWLLSRVAEAKGMVLIVPSYGMGSWNGGRGALRAQEVLIDAGKQLRLDKERVHLCGISNGGLGVCHTVHKDGAAAYKSVVMISPVFAVEEINKLHRVKEWQDASLLVLTGRQDERIPLSYVEEQARKLREAGAHVDLESVENADHFMLFSHWEKIQQRLEFWFATHD